MYWNFLPPDELENATPEFTTAVNRKTVVISKAFGIEGKKLLKPDDDFDPIKEINEQFEGEQSRIRATRASEYQELAKEHPELIDKLPNFPLKIFSGKESPKSDTKGVFFCFRIPRPDSEAIDSETGEPRWTEGCGVTPSGSFAVSMVRCLQPSLLKLQNSYEVNLRHLANASSVKTT